MLMLLNYSSSSLQLDINIAKDIGNIKASVLELRKEEKDFSARKVLKYSEQFNNKISEAKQQIDILSKDFAEVGLSMPELASMGSILTEYQVQFNKVVSLQKRSV